MNNYLIGDLSNLRPLQEKPILLMMSTVWCSDKFDRKIALCVVSDLYVVLIQCDDYHDPAADQKA